MSGIDPSDPGFCSRLGPGGCMRPYDHAGPCEPPEGQCHTCGRATDGQFCSAVCANVPDPIDEDPPHDRDVA